MLSVRYAGKNAYSAGKTSGVLRGGASEANMGYVLAHCGFKLASKVKYFYWSNSCEVMKMQSV